LRFSLPENIPIQYVKLGHDRFFPKKNILILSIIVGLRFWWGNPWERDHWGVSGVYGRIILGWIFRKWDVGGMYWIGLVQDRDI
jgi:hypothetical protein